MPPSIAHKNTYPGWIGYFFPDYAAKALNCGTMGKLLNHKQFNDPSIQLTLVAFFVLWLSRYIVEGYPQDGVHTGVFKIDTQLPMASYI